MKKNIVEPIKKIVKKFTSPVTSRISDNFIQIDKDRLHLIEKSIKQNYHTGWRSESNYSKEKYQDDLNAHLYIRLENIRNTIVPWLDNATPLSNKHILEIGCGTGSSTLALTEQGAKIIGIDIDEGALLVARERLSIYGVEAQFIALNAQDISKNFSSKFDLIIFYACLEHMTITERVASLRAAWEMLPSGGLLVVVETPNRLWYFDNHTSMLPFFHWLPNDLAFLYSKFSPRENFCELYNEHNMASMEKFLRRGRGMSFHEFDLSIGRVDKLKVISSLSAFEEDKKKIKKSELDRQYKSLLMSIYPNIHEGFFNNNLDLILEKS